MVQSIQAGNTANTAFYNPIQNTFGAAKVSTTEAQTTSAAAKNEDETTTVSAQGDTVTISNAGAQQAAKTFTAQSASSVWDSSDSSYTDATAAAISSAVSSVGINEYTAVKNENAANSAAISGSSSSSSTDSNLSEYTESELKEMLQNGEITQAEYDAEIKSRQGNDTSSDEESGNDAASGASQTEA